MMLFFDSLVVFFLSVPRLLLPFRPYLSEYSWCLFRLSERTLVSVCSVCGAGCLAACFRWCAQSSFGDAIVEAIGWTYENYATQFLGKLDTFLGLGGRYAKIQAQGRSMGNSWKTANAAVKAAVAARQLQQKEMKKQKNREKEKKKKIKAAAAAASKKGEDPQQAAAEAQKKEEEEEKKDDLPSAEDVRTLISLARV